jgi:hypothetical protein
VLSSLVYERQVLPHEQRSCNLHPSLPLMPHHS